MKKLIATLFVMTLGFSLVAVAGPTYDLSNEATGEISVLEPVQYNPGTKTTTYSASSTLKVNYTVTDSVNRRLLDLVKVKDENGNIVKDENGNYVYASNPETGKYETKWYGNNGKTDFDLAHVYFTANDDYHMALFVDVDSHPTSELRIDSTLNITDYGIYLYEDNDPTAGISDYISLYKKDYAITAGTNFGVYYIADTTYQVVDPQYDPNNADLSKTVIDGVELTDTTGKRYTTDANWVASFDWEKNGNHSVDANDAWYSDTDMASREAIFCLFQGPFDAVSPAFLEWQHVEFGFVTTGQPLPGTLATLLIGGLCAGALRKRNKK